MDHSLVQAIEKALGWTGANGLGGLFTRGSLPDLDLCSRLLTPEKLLDVVMRRSLAPPQFRCFHNGEELHPDAYLTQVVTRRGQTLPAANMDRLGQYLRAGCTVVLDAMDSFDPTMEIACRALQWWSHELVQVNTYLTTNDAKGFKLHWDDHDVVIVQIAGEKSWEVRGQSRPVPMYIDAAPNQTPPEGTVWSGIMRTGDVMHIPRGYWHQATRSDRGDGYSLHITFGFQKRTGVDWLSWVANHSREEEPFRHDLNRWGSIDDLIEQEQVLKTLASQMLTDYPVEAYLQAREDERPPPRYVATWGVFGPPKQVVCVTDFPPRVERLQSGVTVTAVGKRTTFNARAERALTLLLTGQPVELAAVTEETGVDATELAGVLIKEGLCAEVTEALSSGYTGLIPTGTFSNAR
jgi:hypothetical protein